MDMKEITFNMVWWALFLVLLYLGLFCHGNKTLDSLFVWLSGFLTGTALMRIFEKLVK